MRPLYRWIGNIYSFNWTPLPKFKASHAKPGMWRRVHSMMLRITSELIETRPA